jgi:hypothetical protein
MRLAALGRADVNKQTDRQRPEAIHKKLSFQLAV